MLHSFHNHCKHWFQPHRIPLQKRMNVHYALRRKSISGIYQEARRTPSFRYAVTVVVVVLQDGDAHPRTPASSIGEKLSVVRRGAQNSIVRRFPRLTAPLRSPEVRRGWRAGNKQRPAMEEHLSKGTSRRYRTVLIKWNLGYFSFIFSRSLRGFVLRFASHWSKLSLELISSRFQQFPHVAISSSNWKNYAFLRFYVFIPLHCYSQLAPNLTKYELYTKRRYFVQQTTTQLTWSEKHDIW